MLQSGTNMYTQRNIELFINLMTENFENIHHLSLLSFQAQNSPVPGILPIVPHLLDWVRYDVNREAIGLVLRRT